MERHADELLATTQAHEITMPHDSEEEWMNNICGGCCGAENCRSCLLSWFLPCFMFGRVSDRFERADKHDEKPTTLNKHCLEYEVASHVCLGPVATFLLRRSIRKEFGMKGNGFADALASSFCQPCTLGQMEREVKHRKGHPKPTQRMVTTPYARDNSSMGPAVPTAPGSEAPEAPYAVPADTMAYTPNDPAATPAPTRAPTAPIDAEKAPVADPALAEDPTKAPAADDLTDKEKIAPPPVADDPAKPAPTPPVDAAPPVDADAPVKPPSPAEKVPDDVAGTPPLPVKQLTQSNLVEPPPAAADVPDAAPPVAPPEPALDSPVKPPSPAVPDQPLDAVPPADDIEKPEVVPGAL